MGKTLTYVINDPLELNLSYMPFINEGGLFIPTSDQFELGEKVQVDLSLATKNETLKIEGKVVWITPPNALHHVLPGIGIQFIGAQAAKIKAQLETSLDVKMDIGGYTYGIMGRSSNKEAK